MSTCCVAFPLSLGDDGSRGAPAINNGSEGAAPLEPEVIVLLVNSLYDKWVHV